MNNIILQQNYYQLFDLPLDYRIDNNKLLNNMRNLQQQYHPDKYASDEEKQSESLLLSSYINQAYQTLSDNLSRAIYLLKLNNIDVDLVHDTKFSSEFLLQQIELREEISYAEEAADFDKLTELEDMLKISINELTLRIESLFFQKEYIEIIESIKQLSFYVKLSQVVDGILANL